MRNGLALIAAIVILVTPAFGGARTTAVPFQTVARGVHSGIRAPLRTTVRSDKEWQSLWRRHAAGLNPLSPAPRITFAREIVIAVFAGEVAAPTQVSIQRIERSAGGLQVLVMIAGRSPGPEPTDPAIQTPFHIVRIARTSGPITFATLPAREPSRPGP